MVLIAVTCSLFLALVGAMGVAAPVRFADVVRRIQTPAGLYFATGFRILFGLALFLAAPASRAPAPLLVIGIIGIVAGIATPFFGLRRFRALLDRISARGPAVVRAWACIALGLWLSLAYAVLPKAI